MPDALAELDQPRDALDELGGSPPKRRGLLEPEEPETVGAGLRNLLRDIPTAAWSIPRSAWDLASLLGRSVGRPQTLTETAAATLGQLASLGPMGLAREAGRHPVQAGLTVAGLVEPALWLRGRAFLPPRIRGFTPPPGMFPAPPPQGPSPILELAAQAIRTGPARPQPITELAAAATRPGYIPPHPGFEPYTGPLLPEAAAGARVSSAALAPPGGPGAPALVPAPPTRPSPPGVQLPPRFGPPPGAPPRGTGFPLHGLGAETGPVVSQEVNPAAWNLEPAQARRVMHGLQSMGIDTRQVRTFDDMRQVARELGYDEPATLAEKFRPIASDAEAVQSAEQIHGWQTEAKALMDQRNQAGLTTEDAKLIDQRLGQVQGLVERAFYRRITGATEWGRMGAALRIMAEGDMDEPRWMALARSQVERGGGQFTDEMRTALRQAINTGQRGNIIAAITAMKDPGWWRKFTTLLRAGMLMWPKTDMVNVIGNGSVAMMEHVSQLPSMLVDLLASRVTGKRTAGLSVGAIKAGAQAVPEAGRMALESLRGVTSNPQLQKWNLNHDVVFGGPGSWKLEQALAPFLNAYKNVAFGKLGAEDVLARHPQYAELTYELAKVDVRNQGLKGQVALDHIDQFVKKPPKNALEMAEAEARYRVFQTRDRSTRAISAVAGLPPVEPFMLFTTTPFNLARVAFDYSPFGAPKAFLNVLAQKPGFRQRYLVRGVGRSLTGSALAWLGYQAYQQGLATGTRPRSGKELALREAVRRPSNALKMAWGWVPLDRLQPLAQMFGYGVDIGEELDAGTKWGPELLERVVERGGKRFLELPSLQQQARAYQAVTQGPPTEGPSRFVHGVIEGLATGLVPSPVAGAARSTDLGPERRPEGITQAMAARVPGLRQKLEPQINVWGATIPARGGGRQPQQVLNEMLNPFMPANPDTSTAAAVADRIGYAPRKANPVRTLPDGRKVRLEGPELTGFWREVGDANRQVFEALDGSGLDRPANPTEKRLAQNQAKRMLSRLTLPIYLKWGVDLAEELGPPPEEEQ